jgi:hypothetical protein
MKTIVLFLTIILVITKFCQAQDYNSLLLNDAKFKHLDSLSAKFNTLHKDSIYSLSRLYDLKRIKLKNSMMYKTCKGDSMSFGNRRTHEVAENLYALGKIKLKKNTFGYLVFYKGFDCEMTYSILMFLVNIKTKTCTKIKIKESYGCEGGMGDIESWLVDINKDGNSDILIQEKKQRSTKEVDELIAKHYCYKWVNGKYIKEKLSEADFEKYKGFLDKSSYVTYFDKNKLD